MKGECIDGDKIMFKNMLPTDIRGLKSCSQFMSFVHSVPIVPLLLC